jgi:uroporphyrinogen-III decarboxylase
MSGKELFLAALRNERTERPPVMYQHLGGAHHLMEATGRTLKDAYSDPYAFAELSMAAYRMFGYDNVMAGWGDLLMEASAFGAGLEFSSDRRYPKEIPVPLDRVDSLAPIDPITDSQWSVPIKAAAIMNDAIGKEVLVLGCMSSPFIVASSVVGYENLLVSQMVDPDLTHKLLNTITQSQRMQAEHLSDFANLEAVFVSDALADADQNTLELCQRFDLHYTAMVVEALHAEGLKVIVHNCSEAPYAAEQVAAFRPEALHLPLRWRGYEEAKRALREKSCIVAGIDHRALIYDAAPDEILAEVTRVRRQHEGPEGLVIAPACELAFDTPLDNITALREAVGQDKDEGG